MCRFLRDAILWETPRLQEGPLDLYLDYSYNDWFTGADGETLNVTLRINTPNGAARGPRRGLAMFLVTADDGTPKKHSSKIIQTR